MTRGRKIEDELDALRCLEAADRAAQRPRDWARASGVDARSLNAWRINLARRGTPPGSTRQPTAFTVVELVPRPEPGMGPRTASPRYVLELHGARLEFGDDANAATLRRVLEVLGSC